MSKSIFLNTVFTLSVISISVLHEMPGLAYVKLPVPSTPAWPFLMSSGGIVDPAEVNCNNISSNAMVETSEGFRTLSAYCQAQTNDSQQPIPLNIKTTARLPWQSPYWSNGNVCRERDTDTVCLTPHAATSLRWPNPLP